MIGISYLVEEGACVTEISYLVEEGAVCDRDLIPGGRGGCV